MCREEARENYSTCAQMCWEEWFPLAVIMPGLGHLPSVPDAYEGIRIWTVPRATHLTNRMRNRIRATGALLKRWAIVSSAAFAACMLSCRAIRAYSMTQCARIEREDRTQCQRMYQACKQRGHCQ